MSDTIYDLVIIGGGPGGYIAANRAGQLGFKVACVEKRGSLGGTCLNVGCIPSKALLQSSELYEEARHKLAAHGIKASGVALDLAAMMGRKDEVVGGLAKGIEMLFKKNKVEYVKGAGRIAAPDKVEVALADGGNRTLAARRILIATGSEVMPLPGIAIDEKRIVSSTGALALSSVPKTLAVIGGGVIGLELGSVWRRLGAEVTVIEFLDRILPGMDGELAKTMQRLLGRQGLKFRLGTKVTAAKAGKSDVTLTLEPAQGVAEGADKSGAAASLKVDVVLVAVGRRPYTEGLGLDEIGVARDKRGFIAVDGHYQTSVPGIFAVGDVIPGPMLAHKAEDEGVVCVETMAGQRPHIDYDAIPGVVYTHPEAATVGKTEEQLKAAGVAYKAGKAVFMANSRARANADADGFVKILADAKSDKVLGVHIVGADAGELIHEAVLAMEFGASAEDIARTCHAHPTLSETVREAALAVDGRPLNS